MDKVDRGSGLVDKLCFTLRSFIKRYQSDFDFGNDREIKRYFAEVQGPATYS